MLIKECMEAFRKYINEDFERVIANNTTQSTKNQQMEEDGGSDPFEDLQNRSKTFKMLWDRMESNLEDTEYHDGESTAEHTRRVHAKMVQLTKDLPSAEQSLMHMLAILHDIGKPDARDETGDKVRFGKHPKLGKELAEKVLDEIAYEQKELLLTLIARHMDILQGLNNKDVKFLAKEKVYPHIERLAMMSRADLGAIGHEKFDDIDNLVHRVHIMKGDMDKAAKEKEKKLAREKAMSPEEFVAQLKSRGLPEKAMLGAIKGKFPYLDMKQIRELL